MILRSVAAVGTLLAALVARRRRNRGQRDPDLRAWIGLPDDLQPADRVEFVRHYRSGSRLIAWLAARNEQSTAYGLLVAFAIVLGIENYTRPIFLATDLWLKPLLPIAFSVYLLGVIVGEKTFRRDERIVR